MLWPICEGHSGLCFLLLVARWDGNMRRRKRIATGPTFYMPFESVLILM